MGQARQLVSDQLVGACIGLLLFTALTLLFKTVAPIHAFMRAEVVGRSPQTVTINITGYKIRDCELSLSSFAGWYRNSDGAWTEASGKVGFPGESTANSSRDAHFFTLQDFGLLKLNGVPKNAEMVRITANHICGDDGDPRISIIGPWTIK